jgi:hypothetical protein
VLQGIHSVYADGTFVYAGRQSGRITGPDAAAAGTPHSVLRWDTVHKRVYQAREYTLRNQPLRDIDFTNPTYGNGTMRPGHPGPPHQHRWFAVDPNNWNAGFRRGIAEVWP